MICAIFSMSSGTLSPLLRRRVDEPDANADERGDHGRWRSA